MTKTLQGQAPAKINLTLDVKSKKPNASFHEIETIYHRISLFDEIMVTQSERFHIIGDFDCHEKDNLLFKAFKLIQSFYPKTPNVKVEVIKNIPIKSGLGGGSSDFATFTKLYFQLFALGEIPEALIKQAGEIGKDIPFFFQAHPCAHGTHFGEMIEPIEFDFSQTPLYLYIPNFGNDTAQAYQSLKTFDTSFTQAFLKNPNLKNSGNTFDQLMKKEPYNALPLTRGRWRGFNNIHLTGSGSVFYSFEDLGPLEGCEKIATKLL